MSAPNSHQEEDGPAVIRLALGSSQSALPRLLSERPPSDRLLSGHLLLERLTGDAVSDLVDLARMQLNGGAETGITERIGSS